MADQSDANNSGFWGVWLYKPIEPKGAGCLEKIAMRSDSGELQIFICHSVDEYEIWFDMAIAEPMPVSR
ncbi:hypothetical protein HORIV_07870 [Vreelandella olivaria]|uniref:Uncharacterized protein n=1 Tax=Vreelandella olivaria TaxID=390919 RepID=A0ABN5WN03_9GAMM|nr:hypothetical protein HORIV_07870 [Halomonas olivaria]